MSPDPNTNLLDRDTGASLSDRLFVPAKHVTDAGSYSEHAQCFMCSESFTDPRYVLSQDMELRRSSGLVPKD